MEKQIFYKQRLINNGYFPIEGQIVTAFVKERQILCKYEDGKFYRHTDDSGNDRLLRFYYNDVTCWLESFTISENIAAIDFEKALAPCVSQFAGAEDFSKAKNTCFELAQAMVLQVVANKDSLIKDYEEVNEDKKRLVRELDMIINGKKGMAKQASLCDIVGQVKTLKEKQDQIIPDSADKLAALINLLDIDFIKIPSGYPALTKENVENAIFQAKAFVLELYDLAQNLFKESPILLSWHFIASKDVPKKEDKYYVMDKYGNQGWAVYSSSGAPAENMSFSEAKSVFGETPIKANDIICWMSNKNKNKK